MYAILNLIIHVLYIYQYVCEKHKRYIAAVNLFIVPCEPTLCTYRFGNYNYSLLEAFRAYIFRQFFFQREII